MAITARKESVAGRRACSGSRPVNSRHSASPPVSAKIAKKTAMRSTVTTLLTAPTPATTPEPSPSSTVPTVLSSWASASRASGDSSATGRSAAQSVKESTSSAPASTSSGMLATIWETVNQPTRTKAPSRSSTLVMAASTAGTPWRRSHRATGHSIETTAKPITEAVTTWVTWRAIHSTAPTATRITRKRAAIPAPRSSQTG